MIDYFQKLSEALSFAWKYKFMWVFGFILTLCMGESSVNTNGLDFEDQDAKINRMFEGIENIDSAQLIAIVVVASVVILILAIIGWYLGSIARSALIKAVEWDEINESFGFKKAWDFGTTRAFRYMWFDFLSFLIVLPFFVVIFSLIFAAILLPAISIMLICILCALSPVLFILLIFWAVVHTIAQRYMILRDKGAWESIKSAFILAQKTVLDYIVGWLVSLIPSCAWMFISFFIMLCPAVVWIALLFASVEAEELVAFGGVLVCGIILLEIFAAIVSSPFTVFMNTYWTKVTIELMDKKDPDGKASN